MQVQRYTLKKDEKLRHKRLVDDLFANGKTLYEFPLRLTWRVIDAEELAGSFRSDIPAKVGRIQMLVTVPKKKRRRAVDRVLMRRRIREAYRLNRVPLKDIAENIDNAGTLSLAFIYMSDKNLPYSLIEARMKRLLFKLEKELQPDNRQTPTP